MMEAIATRVEAIASRFLKVLFHKDLSGTDRLSTSQDEGRESCHVV